MGRRGSCPLATLLLLAASTAAAASAASRLKSDDEAKLIALNLQVEHAIAPLTIEVPAPRFSWQPKHTQRAQHQSAFHVVVRRAALNPGSTVETVWDSGTVRSNRTHVLYAGRNPLVSDADYTWSVTWTDSNGAFSTPALGTFSTALLHGSVDWHGAEWLSSSGNGSLNMYRATLQLDKPPLRARLYIAGLGYYHSTINGVQTDEHLLGPQTTWEARALYDVWDVTALLRQGCNTLGVAMGHGWGSNTHLQAGGGRVKWDRQFIAVLSVTDTEGVTSYFPTVASSASAAQPRPMRFTAGAGPVTYDDIFDGEAYDGRIAAALQGWDTCNPEGVALHWENATKPHVSPADHGAELSVHTLQTRVIRDYSADTAGAITQPRPGVYVYNFSQNMAGVATLRVRGCVAGHIVRLRFGEILWSENGTVHNQFPVKIGGEIAPGQSGDKPGGMARMLANYTCSGAAEEVYRTQFSSYGFQFVQVEGYPSVPMDDAVTASMIGPNFEVAGRFTSSSAVLNKIQHSIVASVTANWANDVPTDW
jgi:alpha-L-rhamnosidase